VARELGLFSKHGLEVTLTRELGWASIREKLLYQDLDAAQAPAPMLFRMIYGLDGKPCNVFTSYYLNAGGNAVTLSAALRRMGVRSAADLKRLVRSKHPERLIFAVVSLYSCHYFLLRRWLLSGGIDPEKEVLIAVLPPDQMLSSLQNGHIEGFCSGEPWNSAAVQAGAGWCPSTSVSLAPAHPEKILLTRSAFAERWPDEHAALLRSVDEACQWCEDPANRPSLVDLLGSCRWFRDSRAALRPALLGPFDCGDGNRVAAADLLRFHGPAINAPTEEKSNWLLAQMRHAKLLTAEHAPQGAFRPDLLEEALGSPAEKAAAAPPRKRKAAVA
jgi:NitT/TauT family transport system ATP-binding protein